MAAVERINDFEGCYAVWKWNIDRVKKKIVQKNPYDSEQVKGLVRCQLAAANHCCTTDYCVPDTTSGGHPHEAAEAAA